MKKILAIMMAIMMLLVSVAAIAEEGTGESGTTSGVNILVDQNVTVAATTAESFTLTKTYSIEGETAILAADTVSFTVSDPARTKSSDNFDAGENSNYPVTIADVAVAYDTANTSGKTKEVEFTVQLPAYDLPGVYSYEITEVDKNTAGVTYIADTLYLNVTVVTNQDTSALELAGIAVHKGSEDGDKIDEFENTYTAGSLTIDKTVTGNMGDRMLDFTFTVTFTAGDTMKNNPAVQDVVNAPITVTTSDPETKGFKTEAATIETSEWKDGTVSQTFTLKHGQSVTFENIPSGVTYVVTESNPNPDGSDYQYKVNDASEVATADVSLEEGTITSSAATASFKNDWNETPDTGIELETLPFVVLMAAAFVGMMLLIARRRKEEN